MCITTITPHAQNSSASLGLKDTVATSPVVLRWLHDSPRTGCARRTRIYVCGANKQ